MTDPNEQSFSAVTVPGAVPANPANAFRPRGSKPISRLRPSPQQVSAVKAFIPRMLLALRGAPKAVDKIEPPGPTALEQFTAMTIGINDNDAFAYVESLLANGASVESIFLDVLAPAARLLGEQWETDATDFANVTLGVSRLHRIMRKYTESFHDDTTCDLANESILLTIVPGEQHSFGLLMAAEFFRRAGWNLCTGPFSSHNELTSLVQNHWFDVVGFSVSSEQRLDVLKADIDAIRCKSRNRNVGIIIGGPMAASQPALMTTMGADMLSSDATTAPQQAHGLIGQMRGH